MLGPIYWYFHLIKKRDEKVKHGFKLDYELTNKIRKARLKKAQTKLK